MYLSFFRKFQNSELGRFVVVGVTTTMVHFIMVSICYLILGLGIGVSTTLAFLVAVACSYAGGYFYTFQSSRRHVESSVRFLVSTLVGLGWNVVVMVLLVDYRAWEYWLAFLPATAVVMLNNFLLSKYWVFPDQE